MLGAVVLAVIRADATWLRKKASRLPLLERMTAADKEAFQQAMNRRFPTQAAPVRSRLLPPGEVASS